MPPTTIANLPAAMRWLGVPERWSLEGGSLTIVAGAETDLFIDPGDGTAHLNAPALVGDLSGDYLLSARVTVPFDATYDAGVLLLHAGDREWAKLCFEYSPDRQPMVVSVVTRGVSDDCNSFDVDGTQVWLRIARIGPAFAFHASTDGATWKLIRHFALGDPDLAAAGFLAQSPTGPGCTITFDQIAYRAERLNDLRDGS